MINQLKERIRKLEEEQRKFLKEHKGHPSQSAWQDADTLTRLIVLKEWLEREEEIIKMIDNLSGTKIVNLYNTMPIKKFSRIDVIKKYLKEEIEKL